MCTSVQSYKVSAAMLYRAAHLGNLLRTPISIGSKIKFIDTMGIGWNFLQNMYNKLYRNMNYLGSENLEFVTMGHHRRSYIWINFSCTKVVDLQIVFM